MIFNPDVSIAPTDQLPIAAIEHAAYLISLELALKGYIRALGFHPVFAPARIGETYKGYPTLNAYLAALNEQNAVIASAISALDGVRLELYGSRWGK